MANRQQKQAAKAARRKQAVAARQQAERLASSPAGRVAAAAAGPVERCLRTADMAEAGIGHVVLARALPSGLLGCGFFLVDLLCLGVKDAYHRELTPSALDERVVELDAAGQALVAIDPASAKALLRGAVAFAESCGMEPAKDYRLAMGLFDGIDAEAAAERFSFGRAGEPLYIPGPNDSATKVRDVQRRLVRARGEEGWDIALPERDRIALQGLLGRVKPGGVRFEDGPVIEHEGSPEGAEAAADPPVEHSA